MKSPDSGGGTDCDQWFSASVAAGLRAGGWDAHHLHNFPVMHHSLSKRWQQTGTSNIVFPPFFHSGRCPTWALSVWKKKHFPGSKEEGNPGQFIMLCPLMIDSCIRAPITRERQPAWNGVNQLSTAGVWRSAKLWLEFSIRIHQASGVARDFCRGIFPHQPYLLSFYQQSEVLRAMENSVYHWLKGQNLKSCQRGAGVAELNDFLSTMPRWDVPKDKADLALPDPTLWFQLRICRYTLLTIQKTDKQQGPTEQHRELYSIPWNSL